MIRILLFFVLFSCSTLNKRDCSKLDWYQQGVEDGKLGKRSTYFLQHALKCQKEPDNAEYLEGRTIGLESFCSYAGGFRDGMSGALYLGQCDENQEIELFRQGRKRGRAVFLKQEQINELQDQLDDLNDPADDTFSNSEHNFKRKEEINYIKKEMAAERRELQEMLEWARTRGYL